MKRKTIDVSKCAASRPTTEDISCGTCHLRDRCLDPRKRKDFACTKWIGKEVDPSGIDFLSMMRDLVQRETVVPDNYAIDDREAPFAPNSYVWNVSDQFLGFKPIPYPKQLQLSLKLFADMCSYCRGPWFDDIPVDADVRDIPKKVMLREFGVCPRCQYTRLDGIREGREKDYDTLISILGQRCVVGNTLLMTTDGLIRIEDWNPNAVQSGWAGRKNIPLRGKYGKRLATCLENGVPVRVSDFWTSKPEIVYQAITKEGVNVTGTAEHPLKMLRGWKTLDSLQKGDVVPIHFGQRIWGKRTDVDESMAALLGFWVSEGAGSSRTISISNYDQDVLNLCLGQMKRLEPNAQVSLMTMRNTHRMEPYEAAVSKDRALYHKMDELLDGAWRKSADRIIPRCILEAPESVVCSFLRALFEGDGWTAENGIAYIGYSSISRELVDQLRVVLLNLGIPTKTRFKWTWATNGSVNQISKPSWSLGIRGRYLKVFRDRIGFMSARKQGWLDSMIATVDLNITDLDRQPYWYDRYPQEIKQKYLIAIAEIDREWSGFTRYRSGGDVSKIPPNFRDVVEDWRRLLYDNVCLSRIRLERYWKKLRDSRYWTCLSVDLRKRLMAFHDEFLNPNTYFTTIDRVRVSREPVVTYDVCVPAHHRFMANGLLNHNSGKSSGMSLITSYQTHMLLKIKNPSAFYGIKSGTVLFNQMIAVNYGNAKTSVFDPLVAAMDDSPWYKIYHELLDRAASRLGEEELYRVKESFIYYKAAGLNISPASPSRRSLRGKTRVGYSLDEMGHFGTDDKQVNIGGMEIWRALSRSLQTVRPAIYMLRKGGRVHVPQAIAVAISSPYSLTDPIMTLHNRTVKSVDNTAYCAIWPTWEANPSIPFKRLSSEFALDPVSAWRDYGCRPPFSANAFITGLNTFKKSVRRDLRSMATQRTVHARVGSKTVMTAKLNFKSVDRETPRLLGMDAGRSLNSFALSVSHIDENERLCYDLFVEVVPRPEMPVSYTLMWENVIEPIIQNLNIVASVSDRWQNYSINDKMSELGVLVTERRLKYGDFVAWRDDLTNGAFDIPNPEMKPYELATADGAEAHWLEDKPVCQLLRQSIIVIDVPGKTVEKPSEGNDDVFRSAVIAHAASLQPEIREVLKPTNPNRQLVGAIGAFVGSTGGTQILTANLVGKTTRPSRPMGVVTSPGRQFS